jgi:hypothetical protein
MRDRLFDPEDGAGGSDIALNAVAVAHMHRAPFAELSFAHDGPPDHGVHTNTLPYRERGCARGAAPGSGVILTLSTPGAPVEPTWR